MSATRRLASVVTVLTLAACMPSPNRAEGYGTRAPRHAPALEDVPVTGHRVWVTFEDGRRIKGELLAAESDGEVVVRTKRDGDERGAFDDVKRARVLVDRNAHKWMIGVGTSTAIMVPLSLIAGLWAVALTPVVGAGGSIALLIIWAESRVVLRGDDLGYLYQYARWPQGWPEEQSGSSVGTPIGPDPEPPAPAPAPVAIEPMPLVR